MQAAHPGQRVEVWFQDEARIGQQGTLTTVWAPKGSRPTAVKQTEYDWVYLYAAVNPVTGASSAMLAPTVNTAHMNQHLAWISREAGPEAHVVLVLDNAGWHVAKDLRVPVNVTLLPLPSYSPELNPAERIWRYLRQRWLSHRLFVDYAELFAVCRDAWNALSAAELRSICRTAWLPPAKEV